MTERIWFHDVTPQIVKDHTPPYMGDHVGLMITEIGPDYLTGTMPVSEKTIQPMGILHGGASCVLAESLGSIAANLCLDHKVSYAVGIHIDASHLKSVKRGGVVTGTARPVHRGKSTQVWEIRIVNESEELVCLSKLTVMVKDK